MILEILLIVLMFKLFLIYTTGQCKSKVCLVGKTALITGGNAGLGLETAKTLASRGCKVIIADKNVTEKTVQDLKNETHNPNISSVHVDLASFESVRNLAKTINSTEDRLDILINNAGIGDCTYKTTNDGIQLIMQVNYFGHFLLTHLLAGLLKKSSPSRIVHISSAAAYWFPTLSVNNIKNEKYGEGCWYSLFKGYGNSKLCQAIASKVFAEKLKDFGVTSNACHPGAVMTDIFKKTIDAQNNLCTKMFFTIISGLVKVFGKSITEGVQTTLHLAMANEVENVTGKFFLDTVEFWQPIQVNDDAFCRNIWKLSEEIVGLRPEEKL